MRPIKAIHIKSAMEIQQKEHDKNISIAIKAWLAFYICRIIHPPVEIERDCTQEVILAEVIGVPHLEGQSSGDLETKRKREMSVLN